MAEAFQIRIKGTGPLFQPGMTERFDHDVQATLMDVGAFGQRLFLDAAPPAPRGIASGGAGLRGSAFHEMRGVPGRREELISFSAYYAPIVHQGRSPGRQPPLGPIELWVRRKLGIEENSVSIAFLIARKIAARGSPGQPFVSAKIPILASYAHRQIDALGQRIAAKLGGQV